MTQDYSFDRKIDRTGSDCLKYDRIQKDFGTSDIIPMWVADMDFATPDFILDAIRKRCEHEILGYSNIPEGWFAAIQNWLLKRYDWNVSAHEIGFLPGIVSGIAFVIQCFTEPGDKILIQTPVYPPFIHLPVKNDRQLVVNTLKFEEGKLQIDFEDFEAKAASGCKLFILCSPHNPGGRIWSKAELQKMADICKRYDILIVSDEIHADLSLPGQTHLPLGHFSSEKSGKVITLMAPSKTFNIPGLGSSFFVIQDAELRHKFQHFLDKSEVSIGTIFAYIGAQAAFENGEDWLKQLTQYLQDNILYVDSFLKEQIPQIKVCMPQASFLIWLDCRELGLSKEALKNFFIQKAKLGLNAGYTFGAGGEGFMRINIGCNRETICQAMLQLKTAVDELLF